MMTKKKNTSNWLYIAAVFIAASALGGLIKLPSPVGSIALDSAPGYFIAVYSNPVLGGIVGALGHIASAASAGFPLGYIHIYVALQMFFWCFIFGIISITINRTWGLIPAGILTVLLNGLVGPYILASVGVITMSLAYGVMSMLTLASVINIFIACIAIILMKKTNQN